MFSRCVLKFNVQLAKVLRILKGVVRCGARVLLLSTFVVPSELLGKFDASGWPGSSVCGVNSDWFERQCHIHRVEFPSDHGCGVCSVCVEDMTVVSGVVVPCRQQKRVIFLTRFFSRGVDCLFCNSRLQSSSGLRLPRHHLSSIVVLSILTFLQATVGQILWCFLLVSSSCQ